MKHCVKLNREFIIKGYQELQPRISYGTNNSEFYDGILYKKVSVDNVDELLQIIPEDKRENFRVLVMKINRKIPPHTDSYIKSTINFYIKTENCVTKFYEPKVESPKRRKISNQKEGFIYEEKDLSEVESFVANPNEAWLLNVQTPHAVHPTGNMKERIAIALGTTMSYEEVYQILKESEYV
jgi:hypothetical protein